MKIFPTLNIDGATVAPVSDPDDGYRVLVVLAGTSGQEPRPVSIEHAELLGRALLVQVRIARRARSRWRRRQRRKDRR